MSLELTSNEADCLQSLSGSALEMSLGRMSKAKARAMIRQMLNPTASPSLPDMMAANIKRYYPHQLSPRQRVFIGLTDYEAFYGGAAGGGKSDALLAAALRYVHVPGYRAIIFRRTRPNLEDLIERTLEWWSKLGPKFNASRLRWRFPEGGTIYFGHMQHEKDKYNFKGPGYQFVGWDELSEFVESQYNYLFSRVRGPEDPLSPLAAVPRQVLSASNPDGEGRDWVKARFVSDEAAEAITTGVYGMTYWNELLDGSGRVSLRLPFVPSRAEENPGVNAEAYFRDSLSRLDPVTRDRLQRGDWNIRAEGKIAASSIRYYKMQGDMLTVVLPDGGQGAIIHLAQCQRFATIDTAGTSQEEADTKRGKPASWSVVAVWDYHRGSDLLFLRHIWRQRAGWNDLKTAAKSVLTEWGRCRAYVENAKNGPELGVELRGAGFHVELVATVLPGMDSYRGAKLERAITSGMLNRFDAGGLLVPSFSDAPPPWLHAYVNELTGWTGLPDETFDQGDVTSHACYKCKQTATSWGGVIKPSHKGLGFKPLGV